MILGLCDLDRLALGDVGLNKMLVVQGPLDLDIECLAHRTAKTLRGEQGSDGRSVALEEHQHAGRLNEEIKRWA